MPTRPLWTAALSLVVLGYTAVIPASLGAANLPADTTDTGHFEKVVLVENTTDPIELDIAPDGRVFFVEREGPIRVWRPDTKTTEMVGFLDVEMLNEDGMLGITLDPDFSENGWIYVYYSPSSAEPKNVLSRFTIEDNRIAPGSKKTLLEVPTQREECCHTGGSLAFGPDGNLFLSTGDNSNPFASDGFAPIDERPGREPWDAQRSSANTMDLRGKILRIDPQPDGTYEIPSGNLFSEEEEGLPEIYTMGNRNPYRISVDQETGWLYWGDVGPDAGAADPDRGPAGHDEFNQAKEAGNYGWPLFVGDNKAYHEYNFDTEESGPAFNPNRPRNRSVNNSGVEILPPAQPALIWYPYGPSEEFPELDTGGRTAMAGPVYNYNESSVGSRGLPETYDGSVFFYEWARNFFKEVGLDGTGDITAIKPFLDEMTIERPMEMEVGPDGRLYIIEWGPNFWGMTDEARILRIDYYPSRARPPAAEIQATPRAGSVPLTVEFSAFESFSRNDDQPLDYSWDFDGNGTADAEGPRASITYEDAGRYTARLTVTEASGLTTTVEQSIAAGNTFPSVTIQRPVHGGFFSYGEPVPFDLAVSDREDASIETSRLTVEPYQVHNSHTHALPVVQGSSGSFEMTADTSHGPYILKRAAELTATYTDTEGPGSFDLSDAARAVLHPKRLQAEHYDDSYQASRQISGPIRERTFYGQLQGTNGGYAVYRPINLHRIDSVTVRAAGESDGTLELRLDAPAGEILAEMEIPAAATEQAEAESEKNPEEGSGGDDGPDWRQVTVPITNPGGTRDLYLVFSDLEEGANLKVDWLEFHGSGVNGE
jgi:glucose/arabinose dehydrogenase